MLQNKQNSAHMEIFGSLITVEISTVIRYTIKCT